jgi:hypothetical protein
MANDEHVALLKQGVAAWNAWRRDNPDVRPDFSGADLIIPAKVRVGAAATVTSDLYMPIQLLHGAPPIGPPVRSRR